MVSEIAIPEGEHGDSSHHRFFLNHQTPPAAAKLIAGELLPQPGGAGNKQRQMLLTFPQVLPLQGKTSLAHSATRVLADAQIFHILPR